jgi:hypothetical protein
MTVFSAFLHCLCLAAIGLEAYHPPVGLMAYHYCHHPNDLRWVEVQVIDHGAKRVNSGLAELIFKRFQWNIQTDH